MNREVMSRQMFRNGGPVYMAGGGTPGGVVEEFAAIFASGDTDAFMDFFVENESALRDEARRTRNPSLVNMINLIDKMEAADANKTIAETQRLAQMPSENMVEVARPGGTSYIQDPLQKLPFGGEKVQPGRPYEELGTYLQQPTLDYAESAPQPDLNNYAGIQDFAVGGVAAPAPMPAAPGPEGIASLPNQAAMEAMPLEGVAQEATQIGVDPSAVEAMLGEVSNKVGNLENAESYEEVINGIREADAPIEVRYKELAGFVGEEDAMQTPESVLAMLQPVIMMAGIDQGIGALASEEMTAPVTGDMAGGIMSTVNMGQEGVPPVNFNQGGAVQYFAPANENRVAGAMPGGRLGQLYGEKRDLYRSIMGGGEQEKEYQKQKDLTEAQMLFDIARGAFDFAGGAGKPGRSPAEQLAAAASPVLANIGTRAGELSKFKQAQAKEARAMDLAALTAAEGALTAETKAAADVELAKIKKAADKKDNVLFTNPLTGQTRRVDKEKGTEVEQAIADGFTVEGVLKNNSVVTLYDKEGNPSTFSLTTPEGVVEYNKALKAGLSGKEPNNKLFGGGTLGMLKNILEGKGSSDLAYRYSLNQTKPDETNMIEGAINQYTNEIREYDPTSGKERIYAENKLIQPWVDALRKRSAIKGASMPTNIGPKEQARLNLPKNEIETPGGEKKDDKNFVKTIQQALGEKPAKEGTVPIKGKTYDSLTKEVAALGAMENITGQLPAIKAFANRFGEFLTGGPFFRDTAKAQNLLNNINTTVTVGLMQAIPGRESEQLRQEIKEILPPVASFTQGTEVALDKIDGFIGYLNIQIAGLNKLVESPRTEGKVGEINQNIEIIKTYRDVYQGIADQLVAESAPASAKKLRDTQIPIGKFFKGGQLPSVLQQGR